MREVHFDSLLSSNIGLTAYKVCGGGKKPRGERSPNPSPPLPWRMFTVALLVPPPPLINLFAHTRFHSSPLGSGSQSSYP